MIKKLFLITCCIFASYSYAAENKVNLDDVKCDTEGVLFSVAQGLSSANNIPGEYGYDFIKTDTIYRSPKKSKFNLRCSSNVNLINMSNKSIVQSFVVDYSLQDDGRGSYGIGFQPK